MAEFKFTAKITITTFTTIEADTAEEAIILAQDRQDYMMIASNNGDEECDVWMIEDMDGTAYDITLDK